MRGRILIGTRGSKLALAQAGWVARELEARAGVGVELLRIKTSGDRLRGSLAAAGGKGLFVKEIEEALLKGAVDLAVHSMKDLPGVLPQGLAIVGVPRREAPYDLLVTRNGCSLQELPPRATVGTSSLRRRVQLLAARPDLEVVALRGNVDTRLRKLSRGELSAVVVAAAGLKRLGITEAQAVVLPPERFIPAIGQGALALEARQDAAWVIEAVSTLSDRDSWEAVSAERAFLAAIGGDCQTPVAAHARISDGRVHLTALLAAPDGSIVVKDAQSGRRGDAERIGRELGERVLAAGGRRIMEMLRGSAAN